MTAMWAELSQASCSNVDGQRDGKAPLLGVFKDSALATPLIAERQGSAGRL
jgi:hypothetical protein